MLVQIGTNDPRTGEANETMSFGGQEVKGQGHTRSKIDLEA